MSQGKFIIVEGGDGAGKTSFVSFLKEKHPEFVYSREPGGLGFSQKIRELVLSPEAQYADTLAMFLLFWASKAQNISSIVLPAIKAGKIVVTDRFEVSTYGYQVGEDNNLENLFWETRATCLQGIVPVYLNFDVSVDVARSRTDTRGDQNHFDVRNEEYRNRVRFWYRKFFDDERIISVPVDASQPRDLMLSSGYEAFQEALCM